MKRAKRTKQSSAVRTGGTVEVSDDLPSQIPVLDQEVGIVARLQHDIDEMPDHAIRNDGPSSSVEHGCTALIDHDAVPLAASVAPMPPQPLTLREAASLLSLSEDVTRSQIRAGKLRAFKAGEHWRVPPDSITDYIVAQLAKAKPR